MVCCSSQAFAWCCTMGPEPPDVSNTKAGGGGEGGYVALTCTPHLWGAGRAGPLKASQHV